MTTASELSGGLLRLQAALDSMRETIRDYGDELGRVKIERDLAHQEAEQYCEEADEWRKMHQQARSDARHYAAEAYDATRNTPRVITADELRPGMWVAHKLSGGSWATAKVRERSKFLDSEKFVLLEDAREPEPETYTCPDCGNSVKRVEADA